MNQTFEKIKTVIKKSNHELKDRLLIELKDFVKVEEICTVDGRQIYSTYKIRRENNTANISGYDSLLPNLLSLVMQNNVQIKMLSITSNTSKYLIFLDDEVKNIIGILEFHDIHIDPKVELTKKGFLRGHWTNSKFYLNNKEIKKES